MEGWRIISLILCLRGGGVKGIAYAGAMQALRERDILPRILRVGGASAGAIHALLLALRYTPEEMRDILRQVDFKTFEDDSSFFLRDVARLLRDYGWHKGKMFLQWTRDVLQHKTGSGETTFLELQEKDEFLDLYLIGANLSTRFSEVFSHEHTPDMPVAEAVRISMSIPLFFYGQETHGCGRPGAYLCRWGGAGQLPDKAVRPAEISEKSGIFSGSGVLRRT